jgi:hypothetical protein
MTAATDRATSGEHVQESPSEHGRRVSTKTLWIVAGLASLMALAFAAWSIDLPNFLWIDEANSINVAHHSVSRLPALVGRDSSPPLWYVVLHYWMQAFGDSETSVHVLALIPALLTIPMAWHAGRVLGGEFVAWSAAVLVTASTFVGFYATEARMYSMAMLISCLVMAEWGQAFQHGKRNHRYGFAAALTAALYIHTWGIFLAAALIPATLVLRLRAAGRRQTIKDLAIGFGIPTLAYAPWVSVLYYQSSHTGHPGGPIPGSVEAFADVAVVVGETTLLGLLVVGVFGVAWRRFHPSPCRNTAPVGFLLLAGTGAVLLLAGIATQHKPLWEPRYIGLLLGPLLLSLVLIASADVIGRSVVAMLAVIGLLSTAAAATDRDRTLAQRSFKGGGTSQVALHLRPLVHRGDLLVTDYSRVPTFYYYIGDRLRYASYIGNLNPTEINGRDSETRMAQTTPQEAWRVADQLQPGQQLISATDRHPTSTEFWRIRNRAMHIWANAFAADPRLVHVLHRNLWVGSNYAGTIDIYTPKTDD